MDGFKTGSHLVVEPFVHVQVTEEPVLEIHLRVYPVQKTVQLGFVGIGSPEDDPGVGCGKCRGIGYNWKLRGRRF